MDFLKDFDKMIKKMEGVSTDTSPPKYWFGSGNYVLNKIVSGNFNHCIPQGRVTGLAGPSGAGKSFLLANLIKQAQKDGAMILLIDSEGAFDDDFAKAIGIDIDDPYYRSMRVVTIPNVIKIVSSFIRGYRKEYEGDENPPKVLIAIDSCDMLQTDSEFEKYLKGDANADQGQHSKQTKSMLKTFVNDVSDLNISMIVTKQVYPAGRDQILKGEGVWVVNEAIRYSLSQIILITKLKLKQKVGTDNSVTGIRMICQAFKTRFTKPFQTVTIEVPYETGMDPLSGLAEVATGLGVLKKAGSWVYIEGDEKNKWYAKDIAQYAEQIIEKCNEKSNAFLQVSEEDERDMIVEAQKPKLPQTTIVEEDVEVGQESDYDDFIVDED